MGLAGEGEGGREIELMFTILKIHYFVFVFPISHHTHCPSPVWSDMADVRNPGVQRRTPPPPPFPTPPLKTEHKSTIVLVLILIACLHRALCAALCAGSTPPLDSHRVFSFLPCVRLLRALPSPKSNHYPVHS